MSEPVTTPTTPKPRKGPRPSAETIRKRVIYLIGSGNVKELDEAGYVVVPRDALVELTSMVALCAAPVAAANGADPHE
jgi:hypothetical protein